MKRRCAFLCCLPAIAWLFALAVDSTAAEAAFSARDMAGKRVMVLGDSITQDGRYVSFVEYYLDKLYPHDRFDIVNVGLSSETTSGLSEPGHPFPRPCVHERLARALDKVKPQVVFACYGMNDGIYHPQSPERMKAFQDGVRRLIETAQGHGVEQVVLLTPPVFDPTAFGNLMKEGDKWQYFVPYEKYDDVLADYARWIMSLRIKGVSAIDLHTPMTEFLAERRKTEAKYRLASDGVHPGDLGHLIMALAILRGMGVEGLPKDPERALGPLLHNSLFQLVHQHRKLRSDNWLPYIGYTRGGTFHRDKIDDVEQKAGELQKKIDELRTSEPRSTSEYHQTDRDRAGETASVSSSAVDNAAPGGGTAVAPISAEELARAWPCFRGRGGTGISPYANVPDDWDGPSGKNIVWKTPVPLSGNSSPVIVAGHIFLTGADENQRQVYCFDTASGKKLWQADVPSTPDSRKPVKLNDDTGYAACTAVTDGRYVAAIFPNGDLAAFDLNGKLAWSKSLGIPENPYGHAASLAIYKDLVLVPFDQASAKAARSRLRGIDIATGRIVWEQTRAVPSSWTSPIVIHAGNREQVVTVADSWVIAYDPADGKELWRVKTDHGDAAPSPVAAGDIVYATIDDNAPLTAIRADGSGNVTATHVLWKGEDNVPNICSPLATEEFVYLLKSEGIVTSCDARKGDKLWEEDLGEFKCKSSLSMVAKELFVFGEEGKCWVLAPTREGVKRVRQTDLGEGCVTSPAFQDGRMYLRGKKDLFCIGKK